MSETQAFMRKGYFFQRMDQISRTEKTRDAFLAALKNLQRDYISILQEFNLLEPNAPEEVHAPNKHEAHLRRHWFPEKRSAYSAWWQEWQPIEPILREGYTRAFEEAQRRGWWAIDGYWLSTGTRVAVGVGVNEEQEKISVIRVTPPCPTYKADTSIVAVVECKGIKPVEEVSEIIELVKPEYVQAKWIPAKITRRGVNWTTDSDQW